MDANDEELEKVLEAATRVFAGLGYDGTSLGLVAEAAGVGVEEVRRKAGGKADLYRAVMLRAHEVERAAMAEAVGRLSPDRRLDREGFAALLDAYLDFSFAHPHLVSLRSHRWLGDAADVREIEESYARPRLLWTTTALRDRAAPGLDLDYIVWTLPWLVSGFLTNGVMRSAERHEGEEAGTHLTPRDQVDFRRYLHALFDRLLSFPA